MATFVFDAHTGTTNGSDWAAARGGVLRLHSPPFPHMRNRCLCGRPERSRARYAFIGAQRRPLTARTTLKLASEGKGDLEGSSSQRDLKTVV